MPSASTKVESPTSPEVLEPLNKALGIVDKKIRNLEKRKLKLDAYREKQGTGECLEKDQQVAVDKYGEVIQNLEFARDLQKQFNAINADAEKLLKKQAKRGKSEKQLREVKRVREVLQLQGLLDNLGSDNVRADFQSGKHGAIVLTEENLDQLDELYKLISPTRDADNYHKSLSDASEHIVNLLDAKDKAVTGTTYKELKELLDLISGCGYFERAKSEDTEEGEGDEVAEVEFEVVEHEDVPEPDSEEVQSSLPPEVDDTETQSQLPQASQLSNDVSVAPLEVQALVPGIVAEADSFFSSSNAQAVQQQQQQQQQQHQQQDLAQQQAAAAAAAAFNRTRPFQEIVSSVQGSFNFLQESTIEGSADAKREFSPHMDPAVVAAHPMPTPPNIPRPPSTQTPEATSLSQPGYVAPAYDQQPLEGEAAAIDQTTQDPVHSAQTHEYTNTSYVSQGQLTQTLQTDNLFTSGIEQSQSGIAHAVLPGQTASDATSISQFEIPPQLPMPPGHDSTQESQQSQVDANAKPAYPMNPNADEFQSLIYSQTDAAGEEDVASKTNTDAQNYQDESYGSRDNYHQNRGGRGGFRSDRGGRGYNRDRGMSNGLSRGGRGGSGGGGNYQGYPPRNDYRPEGYQGYGRDGFSSRGGFKRGGDRGSDSGDRGNRGNNRGGPRGGSGFRGGPRGAARGGFGNQPATGTGGFGRPNFNQPAQ